MNETPGIDTALTSRDRLALRKWGAEFVGAGQVRFRLWAPGVDEVQLRLHDNLAPMSRTDNGWHELWADGVSAGDIYQFILPDGRAIPDPASRQQTQDVHGPSLIVDPTTFVWQNAGWCGRPWHEAVIYELHIGTFTSEGTFESAIGKLKDLAQIGITAIEIMPLAAFHGSRGWGYDGVLLYAPHPDYGSPDDLRRLIDFAHGLGMMVILDVVYNHLGTLGNYLPIYAPQFFVEDGTSWGPSLNFELPPVRDFVIQNAAYWLEEFRFDGLRLDAADHLATPGDGKSLLDEFAQRIHDAFADRLVHLVIEDSRNVTGPLEPSDGREPLYRAVWNHDFHHITHVIATDEAVGHFKDFDEDRWDKLRRALAGGFVYQGQPRLSQEGKPSGQPSGHLSPTSFINFLQNHDQIGNRLEGDRLRGLAIGKLVDALMAILLLSPQIPLFFMGDEFGSTQPFRFFCDHPAEMWASERDSRLHEAKNFQTVGDDEEAPDPNCLEAFLVSKLDRSQAARQGGQRHRMFIADLLDKRRLRVLPVIEHANNIAGKSLDAVDGVLAIDWISQGHRLELRCNLTTELLSCPPVQGNVFYRYPKALSVDIATKDCRLPEYAVIFAVAELQPQ
ncbi:malto-oligosyltrehalose trehalohydrolase (plasmid) [Rhizobium sp. ACO-34A]|nr:malto-oligosyltrehalose trehalohydrolase [Rhizobium sp. ACO-34A]ATN37724.1 malto-oligosyltrehalose trehalohydrolase [Rhizobium sp. ACO-34A]